MEQQGDVLLYQSVDGGEIESINGLITMNGGLQTAVYLSIFGGNQYFEDGEVEEQVNKEWWGNIDELPENQYISKTQNFLEGMPPSSFNLNRLEELSKEDLQWMVDSDIATEINVNATIPKLNMVKLEININQEKFEFIENWRNQ